MLTLLCSCAVSRHHASRDPPRGEIRVMSRIAFGCDRTGLFEIGPEHVQAVQIVVDGNAHIRINESIFYLIPDKVVAEFLSF